VVVPFSTPIIAHCLQSKLSRFFLFFILGYLVSMAKKATNKDYVFQDKAKYPCTHYRSWSWDSHAKCVYCRVRLGEQICSREKACELCAGWPAEFWDLYEAKVSSKLSGTLSSPSSVGSKVSRTSRKRRDSSLDSSSSPSDQDRTKKHKSKSRSRSRSMSHSERGEKPAGASSTSALSHSCSSVSNPSSIPNPIPNPQDLWNMFTFMQLLSAQKSAGYWPVGPTQTESMVRAAPDTLRKEGNSGLSTQAYGLVGVGSADQSSANADVTSPCLPGLPCMELAQGAVSRPPGLSGMPHVCGVIRPGDSSAVRSVTSAVDSATSLTNVFGASRMSTGPTGSDKTDQSRNLLISGPPAPHSALMGSGVLVFECISIQASSV